MGDHRPIDTAPAGAGWILALVEGDARQPWVISTRCDGGWCDEGGYGIDPIAWAPLPDPQPEPSGWCKPEGVVKIVPALPGGGIPWVRWVVAVMLPGGEQDPTRDIDIAATLEEARGRAEKLSSALGLPVVEERPFGPRLAHSGVPITSGQEE